MDDQDSRAAAAAPAQPTLWEASDGADGGWHDLVHPTWWPALQPVALELGAVLARVRAEEDAGAHVLPAPQHRLRPLSVPLPDVRVLLVGQDPYPTPDHAVGWSFSAPPGTSPLPASLRNVLRELADDRGVRAASSDLSPWVGRGVMLLNRVLTVRAGESASHRRLGWQAVTDAVVDALAARGTPLVSVLWGRDAQALAPRLAGTAVVTGVHPSPLSASRGFFGSRPFAAVDAALAAQGAPPVDWSLERASAGEPRTTDAGPTDAGPTDAGPTDPRPPGGRP